MIIVKPDPNSHSFRLTHAEKISLKFATDIAAGIDRYIADQSRWEWSPATVRTALSYLLPALGKVASSLPAELRDSLSTNGIDTFNNEPAWAQLIASIYRCFSNDKRRGPVISAFHKMIAIHRDDPKAKPPCQLHVRGGHSDLSELYKVSPEFLLEYKRLIHKFDATGNVETSGLMLKHQTYSLLSLMIADTQVINWLAEEGFEAFVAHPELFDLAEKHRTWQQSMSIPNLLAMHDPVRWRRKTIELLGHIADLTDLYALAEPVFLDLERFATEINRKKPKGRKALTVRDLLTRIQRGLPTILAVLPESAATSIKERGLVVFTESGCALLSQAYQAPSLDTQMVSPIKEVVDTLWPEIKRDVKELLPYQLTFENDFSNRPTYCDYAPVRDLSISLYDDLDALLARLKATLTQESFNMTTVYHHYTQFKAVLMIFREDLERNFRQELLEHGMKAFNHPGYKLQKVVFSLLQNAARTGSLKTTTAYTYRTSVIWFLAQYGYPVVDAYPITISRTEKHLKRLNTDDYYSAEQCREIAYNIESMLTNPEVVGEYRISLLLARILLKTGWNLSPTLGIECADIIRTATPLNPNATTSVVLRKARAGYRSDAYTFSDPEINVSAMRSAVADLLHIRDELTADLRASLPESNPYKSFIFLIERKGVPQRLSMAAAKVVTQMLAKRGCALTFDSKKIRKGGVNHLYRQVQKDLRDYEAAAKHDFKTFESSYYRIDENQSRYTLGKAVDLMGKYFAGKEITSEIVIVTDPAVGLQHTPAGQCASMGNDHESERYGIEHKRIHAERSAALRYCADFLSCIWCKFFRLIADPEHVWKLLSYRDYLLNAMESSALEGDVTENQQSHIGILKERVAEILDRLNTLSPGVVKKGEALLGSRGMHPDWSFAIADAPVGLNS
jgi:hypothetical protein